MIYGIGTDLVQISRIAKTFSRYGNRFVNRILGPLERQEFSQYTRPKEQFLSSRWAIKEAAYKAFSQPGIPFNNFQVVSTREGIRSPIGLVFDGKAKEIAEREHLKSHISVSHENDMCIAFVILEKE